MPDAMLQPRSAFAGLAFAEVLVGLFAVLGGVHRLPATAFGVPSLGCGTPLARRLRIVGGGGGVVRGGLGTSEHNVSLPGLQLSDAPARYA